MNLPSPLPKTRQLQLARQRRVELAKSYMAQNPGMTMQQAMKAAKKLLKRR